jgi:hypothetical protein
MVLVYNRLNKPMLFYTGVNNLIQQHGNINLISQTGYTLFVFDDKTYYNFHYKLITIAKY